ncbi:methionine gamma-lyase-domain-containing protein [Baffinella frigidus]|nr:methionine gamma-lyase-domain-containing protein [Cryptophyta sp. CCMP2293]
MNAVCESVLPPFFPAGNTYSEEEAKELVRQARSRLGDTFAEIDMQTQRTLSKVLKAFRAARVGPHLFAGTDGYGHGDLGRETLDDIYASLFGLSLSLNLALSLSLALALSLALSPSRSLSLSLNLALSRYLTLSHSLNRVRSRSVALALARSLSISQSRSLSLFRSCALSRRRLRHVVVFVDNCYGELVEEREPTHVGADLVAGSLIKNPGGTLAPSGGYIIGKSKLSAPGVDGGATLGQTRLLYQGLFNAPNVVGESLKGTALVAEVMAQLGYLPAHSLSPSLAGVVDFGAYVRGPELGPSLTKKGGRFLSNPPRGGYRTDIISAIQLEERENLLSFCRAVQRNSPVGSYIVPEAGASVGYGDEVVFADGTFIDGSTLELSADGPLRAPFVAYCQGGTHWTHWAIVLEDALQGMKPKYATPPVAAATQEAEARS